ncbi:AAA family ATPase [Bifidobacterium callitrichos]|uniref:AAA family ATPase n=1 Tax=Bifidobacterium callitrichos TaxID=762209 RepID=A0A2T3G8J1_9BIFI|nr:AAA family ATPase [Bifidobacterium callitrichos]PST45806.1 AAA family ATPase [Bifidobacterium callitrichos]
MLRRKITDELRAWKQAGTGKALFLTGARQIGKSTAIREFARAEYPIRAEINLYEDKAAARALAAASDTQDFISRIALFSHQTLIPGKTVVFLDEVQEQPDVMTMVKFLVEDGQFDYILSGSMLGTELKGVRSYPVGSVIEKTMRPMDFEEFCWAIGVQHSTLDMILDCCATGKPVDPHIHQAMLTNYRSYLLVGGMPEAVQLFITTNGNLSAVRSLQNELNRQYRLDISKYAGNRSLQVQEIFDRMPTQLIEGNGRFAVSSIGRGARYERNQQDFLWLVDAGVALKTNCVTEPKSPLMRTSQSPKFKLYQSDTGMLMARYPITTSRAAYLADPSPNLGALYENVIAQELAAQGVALYYYMAKKHGEVDFIADAQDGTTIPFEVKSGRSYRTHAAIDAAMANPDYQIARGVVLSRSNVEQDGDVTYLPLYASWCLAELYGLISTNDDARSRADPFIISTIAV